MIIKIKKFLLFRLFRSLPEADRAHVIMMLPKKHFQEKEAIKGDL